MRYAKMGSRIRVSNMVATFDVEQHRAATKLQAQWRRLKAKATTQRLREDAKALAVLEEREMLAVMHVQRIVRGYLARRPEALELARLHKLITRCKRQWLIRTGKLKPKQLKPLVPVKSPTPDTSEDEEDSVAAGTSRPDTPAGVQSEPSPDPATDAAPQPEPEPEPKVEHKPRVELDPLPVPAPLDLAREKEATATSERGGLPARPPRFERQRSESGMTPKFKTFVPPPREAWGGFGADDGNYSEEDQDDVFFSHFGEL